MTLFIPDSREWKITHGNEYSSYLVL